MVQDIADRDRAAFGLARSYLLGFGADGITPELLDTYLDPNSLSKRRDSLDSVFQVLVTSAQNAAGKVAVVSRSIGGIGSLKGVLRGFNPHEVRELYGADAATLLEDIEREVKPRGKIRKLPNSIWPRFCLSVLSGAEFLSKFEDVAEFSSWVDTFDRDERSRAALPMLLAAEIDGYGFALACDFLMDIGYPNFCKPDIHIQTICVGLGLAPPKSKPYDVFKAMIRVARSNGVTPYSADKLFWLVGSGYFYNHDHLGKNGRIPTRRDEFIARAGRKLGISRARRRR